MSELSGLDPVGRFTGLADIYARCRPDYPPAALEFLMQYCELQPGDLVVDVGCGTGISSRLLAQRGLRVVGIEPNPDMRSKAQAIALPGSHILPEYRDGTAEATALPDRYADAVVAAQAFHWFRPEPTLAEFARILKPRRWAALLWNERDTTDPFTRAFGDVVRSFPPAVEVEDARLSAGQPLLDSPLFREQSLQYFPNEQVLDEEAMIGRALSASYAPKDPVDVAELRSRLSDVFRRFHRDGHVALRYRTSIYVGRVRGITSL